MSAIRPALSAHLALAGMLITIPALAFAQENPHIVPTEEAAFVEQAPATETAVEQAETQSRPQPAADASSKVYFPDAITPESVARARARASQQQQLSPTMGGNAAGAAEQVSRSEPAGQAVAQLSNGGTSERLDQLSNAERQVLLDAVEGTDICERGSDIPALKELCEGRLETRSADFAQNADGSAEDSLLGGGLDSARLATLEAAISRLAGSGADSSDFSNQAIASVALGNATLTDAQATAAESDPTSQLSSETQAVVQAIVQQLGGN